MYMYLLQQPKKIIACNPRFPQTSNLLLQHVRKTCSKKASCIGKKKFQKAWKNTFFVKILKLKHVLYFAAVKTWTLKDQGFFFSAFVTPRCFLFTSFYVCIYVRALPFTEVLLQGENRNRNKLHKNQTEFLTRISH